MTEKIKIHSKEIKIGDIFLALDGKNYHGNKFISESIKNGAKHSKQPSERREQELQNRLHK